MAGWHLGVGGPRPPHVALFALSTRKERVKETPITTSTPTTRTRTMRARSPPPPRHQWKLLERPRRWPRSGRVAAGPWRPWLAGGGAVASMGAVWRCVESRAGGRELGREMGDQGPYVLCPHGECGAEGFLWCGGHPCDGIQSPPQRVAGTLACMALKSLECSLTFFCFGHHVACGILVPQPGTEPRPSAVRTRSPNHWTAREFPVLLLFKRNLRYSSLCPSA